LGGGFGAFGGDSWGVGPFKAKRKGKLGLCECVPTGVGRQTTEGGNSLKEGVQQRKLTFEMAWHVKDVGVGGGGTKGETGRELDDQK